MKLSKASAGFTIIELMMATTVFTVVLMLCTLGLLEVGRSYYKGVTATRTQETARTVLEEVTEAIQFGGGAVVMPPVAAEGTSGFYCVGSKRFSYMRDRQLIDAPSAINPAQQARHVLVVDDVGSCSLATGAQALTGNNPPLTAGSRE